MIPKNINFIYWNLLDILFRSIHPKMSCEKSVLKNFTKFTGKNMCRSLLFNKIACIRLATFLKKRLWHSCLFFCSFLEIFKNSLFYKTPRLAASVFYLNQFKPYVKVKCMGICCVYPADFSTKNLVTLIKIPENFNKITKAISVAILWSFNHALVLNPKYLS